jgi:hydroxymethylbilane synthase
MTDRTLRIGSRGSDLALWQAHWTQRRLEELHPGLRVTVDIIKTTGDKILDAPLSKIGDKGLFTREIEQALLDRSIDLAVHSLKDLPTELPAGLTLGAVTEREDVRDVFLPRPGNPVQTFLDQPHGAEIATGSLRRACQVRAVRPDLRIVEIRGNLNTRLRKLDESAWAGMLLARAGVVRLGWEARIGEAIDVRTVLPAVGQGALGVEIREDDPSVAGLIRPLTHEATLQGVLAERALLRRLEGGCQVPIGAYARVDGGRIVMDALVGSLDGKMVIRGSGDGTVERAEAVGVELAERLLSQGADAILRSIRPAGT